MENLEILKGVVSEETYARLESETKDSQMRLADLHTDEYVSKSKYKDLETQLERANNALASKTTEYDTLAQKAGDNQSLKDEIDRMKSAHETEINNLKAEHQKAEKRSLVVATISTKYHPKDVSDIMPHIDMEKITVDGETVIGLTEQLDPLKEAKSYLFEEAGADGGMRKKKGGFEHGGDTSDADEAILRASFGLKPKNDKKE